MQIKQRHPVTVGDGSALGDEASANVSNRPRDTSSAGSSSAAAAANATGERGLYSTGPARPRGETRASFSSETWVAGPEAFIFRCQDPRRGDQWTFCVSRSTLEELDPATPFKPTAAFDALRARIHSAASARMRVADPLVQQVLSAYDIRYARTGARKNEGKRQR